MPDERNYDVSTVETNSPAPIAHAVRGIDFPCDKEGLRQKAEENGARDDVMQMIDQMPDTEYGDMSDVFKGVGEANDAR